jgi:hypothetical protein
MKSNEFRYTVNADGITTLQDVIEILKAVPFEVTINSLIYKDEMDKLDFLHSKGLVTKYGRVNGKWRMVHTDDELKEKFTSIKRNGIGTIETD